MHLQAGRPRSGLGLHFGSILMRRRTDRQGSSALDVGDWPNGNAPSLRNLNTPCLQIHSTNEI
jgi:hypothetical protein